MTQWHPQSIPPSRLVREKTFALWLTRSPRSRGPLVRTGPLISSIDYGDVKGTIRIYLRYRFTPNDVRRHPFDIYQLHLIAVKTFPLGSVPPPRSE
jgi:hypothetical protein